MSEMSRKAKLIKAIEIAKVAQIGIELSYFDVLEVAGELNEAKEVVAMLNARIAELEEEQVILKDQMREAKNILIDKRLHIDSLYEEGYKLQKRIAELEAENAGLKERVAMLDVTAVFKSLGEMGYIEQTDKLHARIAELERMIKTVDENLLEAGMSVDLYFGNDTPGVMADIIMSLRKRIAEMDGQLKEAVQYEILAKIRAGEGSFTPLPTLPEEQK